MSSKKIIIMIGLVLLVFVLISVLASQLCKPSQNNAVVSAVSNALSTSQPLQSTAVTDPFSWEPVLYQLLAFLSKACPR